MSFPVRREKENCRRAARLAGDVVDERGDEAGAFGGEIVSVF